MKILIGIIVFTFFAFPVFSQAGNQDRFRALSEAMGNTLTRSTAALADFDSRANDDGSIRRYTNYLRLYRTLSSALNESERRLNFLLTANAHRNYIDDEHTNFQELIRSLESLKTEYDNWMRTAR